MLTPLILSVNLSKDGAVLNLAEEARWGGQTAQ